jgi:hypothetical protein
MMNPMAAPLDMNSVVGNANVLFVTFDCLRLDVAQLCLGHERTPHLSALVGDWEPRETPGTFTLPAHLAFFHGFLPTPFGPGPHERLFAMEFDGSLTTGPRTFVFRGVRDIISGFAALGYRTFCVGGVGFFNKLNPLGRVLPGFFQESVWSPELGVACRQSAANQVCAAVDWLAKLPIGQRFLLFMNISATHPPHAFYLPGAKGECFESQAAALTDVDAHLPPLLEAIRRRGECLCLLMGDHGEAYGEDGRFGHRIAHPSVTRVPYAEALLS